MTAQKNYDSLENVLQPFFKLNGYRVNSLEFTKLLLEGMAVAKALPNELLPLDELTISKWRELRSKFQKIISAENSNLSQWMFNESVDFTPSLSQMHSVIQVAVYLLNYIRDKGVKPVELYRHLMQGTKQEKQGIIIPPIEFETVVIQFLNPTLGSSIYCPWDSSAIIALKLVEQPFSVFFEPLTQEIAEVVSLICFVCEINKIMIKVSDPITDPSWCDGDNLLQQFDYTISLPPYRVKYDQNILHDPFNRYDASLKTGDWINIAHQISQTKTRGVVIVPDSFIYKTTGTEKVYKEILLRNGILRAMLRLPKYHASAGSQNIQYALLLEKQNDYIPSDLLLIDFFLKKSFDLEKLDFNAIVDDKNCSDFVARVPLEEVIANDFNLSPERYLIQGDLKKIRQIISLYKDRVCLESIAKVSKPHHFFKSNTGDLKPTICEVTLEDIPESGIVRTASKTFQIAEHYFSSASKQQLQDGDIIMSIKSKIGTVGLITKSVDADETLPWLASQNFVVIRLSKHKLSPLKNEVVLYQYLTSVLIQQYLQSLVQNSSVPMIQIDDIRRLPILIPSLEEQDQMIHEHEKLQTLYHQINAIKKEIDDAKASSWANLLFKSLSK